MTKGQKILNKYTEGITKIAEPLNKLTQIPCLVSIQQGVSSALPMITLGSIFLIAYFWCIGGLGVPVPESLSQMCIKILPMIQVSLKITTLYVCVSCGLSYAKNLKVSENGVTLIVIANYLILNISQNNIFDITFNSGNMIFNLIWSLLMVRIFCFISIECKKISTSNVSSTFLSPIPYVVVLILPWIIKSVLVFDLSSIMSQCMESIISSLDNIFFYTIYKFFSSLFWSIGLHFESITNSIMSPLQLSWTVENALAAQAGIVLTELPHIWVMGLSNWASKWCYGWPLVFLLLCSKVSSLKNLGKKTIVTTTFCVLEPLWFGLPVVMNPYMMAGLIANWTVGSFVTYMIFSLGICNRPFMILPYATPGILQGYLVTGGDWRVILVCAIEFVMGLIIWLPFFKAYEKSLILAEEQEVQ